jgi:hypothetical protein
MTNLGKTLVCIHTGFSLLLCAWALAVYSNRIDWSDRAAQGERPAGVLAGKIKEVKDLMDSLTPAEMALRTGRAQLAAKEALRAQDQVWYLTEMNHLRSGATANNPARAIVFLNNDGRVDPNPANADRPKMVPANDRFGKPLRSLVSYNQEEETVQKELEAVLVRYESLIKEDQALTDRLIGPKGLQQRLVDEKVKREDVVREQEMVRPHLINNVVDSELILKRQKALLDRIKELEKVGVATSAP